MKFFFFLFFRVKAHVPIIITLFTIITFITSRFFLRTQALSYIHTLHSDKSSLYPYQFSLPVYRVDIYIYIHRLLRQENRESYFIHLLYLHTFNIYLFTYIGVRSSGPVQGAATRRPVVRLHQAALPGGEDARRGVRGGRVLGEQRWRRRWRARGDAGE